jgi:MinD-like ATPase involved in chromosome partitioning or flagellar assembly
VELPTYTNIWKIEKRLYKLYDFRLPMPLPIGQVAAFLAIAIPYMLALTLVGMPFSHTWVWLYVLPPGVAAWLVTRPVLEGKRLPELVVSQVRYLLEPRTWCRLAPLVEPDHIVVQARVWCAPPEPAPKPAADPGDAAEPQVRTPATPQPAWPDRPAERARVRAPASSTPVHALARAAAVVTPAARDVVVAVAASRTEEPAAGRSSPAFAAVGPDLEPDGHAAAGAADGEVVAGAGPIVAAGSVGRADSVGVIDSVAGADSVAAAESVAEADSVAAGGWNEAADVTSAADGVTATGADVGDDAGADRIEDASNNGARSGSARGRAVGAGSAPTVRPVLKVRAEPGAGRPLHVVERALRSSRGSWQDRVVVVPGGHRPGTPDHAQRDQARARRPLAGPARIVVLGTTGGAGQTVTTLLTGQLLASLRGEAVAVLDFCGRPGSLTELARQVPRLLPSWLAGGQPAGDRAMPDRERGLQVVTAEHSGPGPRDADRLIDTVAARYPITLADPAPADVPRAVQVADQLVLVTPAGASSAGSLAMTLEWLEAHGHARLAQTSVTVLNGVTRQTAADAERATTVASGRCRAVVRVPWESNLSGGGQLTLTTVHAYTALAGLLVSGLADPALARSAGGGNTSP